LNLLDPNLTSSAARRICLGALSISTGRNGDITGGQVHSEVGGSGVIVGVHVGKVVVGGLGVW